ncbi:osm1 [Symbiodinium pilosum]|uniref:Osm1 protein n=1 Tax=Symbiodinium pilosum TaxID=2952 RepID=A0A812TTM5_SYMPI|nr:osm1 [Symbiodinium pilosum]
MTIGSSKDDIHDVSLSNIDESKEIMDNTFANKLKKHVAFKDEGQTICPTCGSTRAPPTDQSSPTPFARRETSRKVPLTTVILEQQKKQQLRARIKLMSFLSKNGFAARDVNCKKRGAFGFSRTYPLHEAVKQDQASMVRWLLHFGADPGKKDGRGRTAYDYVKKKPAHDEARGCRGLLGVSRE